MLKNKKLLKGIALIMVLVMSMYILSGCGISDIFNKNKKDETDKDETETLSKNNGYEDALDSYFNGLAKGDLKKYEKAYPDFINEKRDLDEDDMDDMHERLEEEYGEKLKCTYEISKEEKIEKDDLERVTEYVEHVYNEDVKISDGKELKVKATIKGSEDEDTDTNKMYVYKIDGEWKILDVSPSTAKEYLKSLENNKKEETTKKEDTSKKEETTKKEDTSSSSKENYEEPIKNFVEGMSEANVNKFLSAFPPFLADELKTVFTEETLKSYVKDIVDEYSNEIKISYKVTDKEELLEDDLNDKVKMVKTELDKNVKITKGYSVDFDIVVSCKGEEETVSETVKVYNIDGKWYIFDF